MFALSVRWLQPFFSGIFLGFLAMVLHECGHLGAAALLDVRIKKVGLKWNKGLFTIREQGTVSQNLLIAMAGPFVNLLLVALGPWYPVFGLANFCYALANMLPIEGSDGIRIAECWKRIRRGELVKLAS
jgi:Zn-dependent protease